MFVILVLNSVDVKSFKQCFSPATTIVGNSLTRTIYLNLQPNPLMLLIPTDNMCQVLQGKTSTAVMKLYSPLNGNVMVPASGTGISFKYLYNQNITVSYTFDTQANYDQTLDATFGGYTVHLDGEYIVEGSVASVFHTLSNQTSCFSTNYFSFSLIDYWLSFDVEPVFCDVPVFTPFFEYQIENKWARLPIHKIDPANEFATGNEYSNTKTNFLSIKRYLLSPFQILENQKYSPQDLATLQQFIDLFKTDKTINVRLSLDYPIKSNSGSITSIPFYVFSKNQLNCFNSLKARSSLNEQNIIFRTGLEGKLECLEINNTNPNYALAQHIKNNWFQVRIDIVIDHMNNYTYYYDKTMTIEQFFSGPYIVFKIPQDELREMMDDKSVTEGTIQMFIEIQDQNGDYLLDFNTLPIQMVRTCINKTVIHQKINGMKIVSWMKNDSRCTNKPKLNTSLYFSAVLTDKNVSTLQQLYKSQIVIDYNNYFNENIVNCSQDSMHTPAICEENRRSNIKPENMNKVVYNYVTTDEYAIIDYTIIDDSRAIHMWSIALSVFGGLLTVVIIVIIYVIVKQQ
ncbi:Conserved_hypothetical protein [Hexamita inflata]|uniref:Uncharacterized protein n=1 Tax=Hexamita inflata TaxID=28002 RepID=A0AA86PTX0_9EUKA|nr:Conserved hypothetical protein [Hexamita inflata]